MRTNSERRPHRRWQSKLVLLIVLPFAAASLVLQGHFFAENLPQVAIWTFGLSLVFGAVVLQLRAATPAAAFTGAVLTANLIFSTAIYPYQPWRTALVPLLVLFLLTFLATGLGREQKERQEISEPRLGRTAAQVAANLGFAAIALSELVQSWLTDTGWFPHVPQSPTFLFTVGLAALAEAAADTVSSEIGQVLGGRPRMITTLRRVEAGTDGAISLVGTLAGAAAALLVAMAGTIAFGGSRTMLAVSCAGGVFGLFFDSLLGATLERRGWLNNDAVNFLSTASAAAFTLGLLGVLIHWES
jgi:uncharacterized protein (TIGR00297 family)